MFDFPDFADGVRQFDHLGVGVPAGEDQVPQARFGFDEVQDLLQVHQFQVQGVIDFIQIRRGVPFGKGGPGGAGKYRFRFSVKDLIINRL